MPAHKPSCPPVAEMRSKMDNRSAVSCMVISMRLTQQSLSTNQRSGSTNCAIHSLIPVVDVQLHYFPNIGIRSV